MCAFLCISLTVLAKNSDAHSAASVYANVYAGVTTPV